MARQNQQVQAGKHNSYLQAFWSADVSGALANYDWDAAPAFQAQAMAGPASKAVAALRKKAAAATSTAARRPRSVHGTRPSLAAAERAGLESESSFDRAAIAQWDLFQSCKLPKPVSSRTLQPQRNADRSVSISATARNKGLGAFRPFVVHLKHPSELPPLKTQQLRLQERPRTAASSCSGARACSSSGAASRPSSAASFAPRTLGSEAPRGSPFMSASVSPLPAQAPAPEQAASSAREEQPGPAVPEAAAPVPLALVELEELVEEEVGKELAERSQNARSPQSQCGRTSPGSPKSEALSAQASAPAPAKVPDAALKKLFSQLDQSGDGFVSLKELRRAVKERTLVQQAAHQYPALHLLLNDAVSEVLFDSLDTDTSGDVSLEEFLSVFGSTLNESEEQRRQRLDFRALFDAMDKDHNGSISVYELRQALKSNPVIMDVVKRSPVLRPLLRASYVQKVCAVFLQFDTDESGSLEWSEFERVCQMTLVG